MDIYDIPFLSSLEIFSYALGVSAQLIIIIVFGSHAFHLYFAQSVFLWIVLVIWL